MTLPSYLRMFETVLPPWLLRIEGLRLIGGIADVIDDHRDRMVGGVKLRFPGLYTLDGVEKLGRERRLRRGPNEDSEVFAERMQRWWEDHRTRGNGYALLEQMLAYFVGTLDPPFDVVSYLGVRHIINTEVVRDTITWGTDETGSWARVWVFVRTTASSVTSTVLESYAAIVRDWLPAHVIGTLVVLHPDTRCWDYPQPIPDWDDTWWLTWDGPTTKEV